MDDYKISRTTRTCAKCEAAFSRGDSFFSTVMDTTEGFQRMDFCPKCWEAVADDEKKKLFSFWKAGIRPKGAPKHRKLDMETAKEFFIRLHGSADADKKNFLYLLTLLILRKRGLVHKTTIREDGGEVLVLHFPKEEDTLYYVKSPPLDEAALEAVKADFSELLDMEL
ncbi:MAG: hypothetical protein E3J72_21280 [Planctomycetota bacterium]|nr:MAG: hypothetical protein E3J72_21280 [Planctomycetota bacterium]